MAAELGENLGLALASRAPAGSIGWLAAVGWATRGKMVLFMLALALTVAGLLTLAVATWRRARGSG